MNLHRKPRLRSIDNYTLPLFPWMASTKCQPARAPAPTPRPKSERSKAVAAMLREVLAELRSDARITEAEAQEEEKRARQEAAEDARCAPVLSETFRIVRANDAPPLAREIQAPMSVFSLATSMFKLRSKAIATPAPKAGKYASRVQPTKGVLRVEGAAYPARWTAEDYKREEQRRARQRPPRPVAKARTKSEKLRELLGAGEGG